MAQLTDQDLGTFTVSQACVHGLLGGVSAVSMLLITDSILYTSPDRACWAC